MTANDDDETGGASNERSGDHRPNGDDHRPNGDGLSNLAELGENGDGPTDGWATLSTDDEGEGDDRGTVLVVDDEESVIESFRAGLEAAGYEVRTATNGGEALVELGPAVDVVLLDRRMPGMSGDDVLEHIHEWGSDCRVIMVTAVEPDVEIVDMDFDEYLTKPVGKSELVETVEQQQLFDRYEELLSEYHSLTRKYATLKATFEREELEHSDAIETLETCRREVRTALEETTEAFADDDISEVLQRAHGELH